MINQNLIHNIERSSAYVLQVNPFHLAFGNCFVSTSTETSLLVMGITASVRLECDNYHFSSFVIF